MNFARSVTNSMVGGETSEKAATKPLQQNNTNSSAVSFLFPEATKRYETACTRYLVLSSDDRMIVQV